MSSKGITIFQKNITAQTFIEYTLLLGIVVMVYLAISPLIRRTSQGLVKLVADQVGNQLNADQGGGESGHLITAQTKTRVDQKKSQTADLDVLTIEMSEQTQTRTEQVMNTGLTE